MPGIPTLLKALTSCNDVNAFIGLAFYYHRFVKVFTQIAQPLQNVTHKGVPFTWTQQCQKAFDHDQLKQKLATALILTYPTAKQAFVLETDTSKVGLGAAQSQI